MNSGTLLLPAGRRRSADDPGIAAAYVLGAAGGGIATAAAAWVASGLTAPLPPVIRAGALVAVVVVAIAARHTAWRRGLALPERRRLVPAERLSSDLRRAALRFGAEMGVGVRTYVPAAAPYVLLAVLLLGRVPLPAAVAAGLGFGVGRSVTIVGRALAHDRDAFTGGLVATLQRLAPLSAATLGVAGLLSVT